MWIVLTACGSKYGGTLSDFREKTTDSVTPLTRPRLYWWHKSHVTPQETCYLKYWRNTHIYRLYDTLTALTTVANFPTKIILEKLANKTKTTKLFYQRPFCY